MAVARGRWKIISLSGGANPAKADFGLIENGDYAAGSFTTSLDASGSVVLTFTPGRAGHDVVDFATATSRPFPTGARGQCPYRSANDVSYQGMFSMSSPSLMRGIAGGLDADTYDWRVVDSGSKWGSTIRPDGRRWGNLTNTLDYLRKCRDTRLGAAVHGEYVRGRLHQRLRDVGVPV